MREENKLPEIEGKANSKNKVGSDILKARNQLHLAIVSKMKNLRICTAPTIVEIFKRWYLWDYWNVETSRSLSLLQLKDAIKMLSIVTQSSAVSMLMAKYNAFSSQREILNLSGGQMKKIIAIAKYGFDLKHSELKEYISKRIDREPYVNHYFAMDITVQEADTIIKALEKWEAKASRKKVG